jgi:hypothetical protein
MHQFKWEWDAITTWNQFVPSLMHPFHSKNVRSIVNNTFAKIGTLGGLLS